MAITRARRDAESKRRCRKGGRTPKIARQQAERKWWCWYSSEGVWLEMGEMVSQLSSMLYWWFYGSYHHRREGTKLLLPDDAFGATSRDLLQATIKKDARMAVLFASHQSVFTTTNGFEQQTVALRNSCSGFPTYQWLSCATVVTSLLPEVVVSRNGCWRMNNMNKLEERRRSY